MSIKVKNISGTSDSSCNCGSWLDHWKKFSGQSLPLSCREATCNGGPDCGAHVQKDSTTDRNWYIIPLCNKHNAKTTELQVKESTVFVSANVSETCGKKAAKAFLGY